MKLRIEAEQHGIEVHGTIWVIESLVRKGLIKETKAIQLLELLKQMNSSLPFHVINQIIKKLRKST